MKRIGVVSGANRGIGLEISRQLARQGILVVMASRDEAAGLSACRALEAEGLSVRHHSLDVTREESVRALAAFIEAEHGGLDILVNNAGVALKGFNAEVARTTLDVNFFGALRLTDALLPLMKSQGRIVMVSSGVADLTGLPDPLRSRLAAPAAAPGVSSGPGLTRDELIGLMRRFVAEVAAGTHEASGWPSSAYRVSKIGLNALTRILASELAGDARAILCNAACPGWVRTDMGGPHASRSAAEGAETPVWLASLPSGGPSGGFFRDKKPVPE